MWINNYDDDEMDIATALTLLRVNGWRHAPRTPDEQAVIEYVFLSPDGKLNVFEDDNEVIDFVEDQGLEIAPEPV